MLLPHNPTEDSGLYVVWLRLRSDRNIRIGSLGTLFFPAGQYAYVGSAQTRRTARIRRHRTVHKRKHWHIDYVRPHTSITRVSLHSGSKEDECALVKQLEQRHGGHRLHKQFGSSDCRCGGHLLYWA